MFTQAIFTTFGPKTQELVMISSMARGMVKEQRSRSEIAKFAMKMFLAVSKTCWWLGFFKISAGCLTEAYLVGQESAHKQNIWENSKGDGHTVQQYHQPFIEHFQPEGEAF